MERIDGIYTGKLKSLVLLFCLLPASCLFNSKPELAGGPGSADETTNGIQASVTYPDGSPVIGARVRL